MAFSLFNNKSFSKLSPRSKVAASSVGEASSLSTKSDLNVIELSFNQGKIGKNLSSCLHAQNACVSITCETLSTWLSLSNEKKPSEDQVEGAVALDASLDSDPVDDLSFEVLTMSDQTFEMVDHKEGVVDIRNIDTLKTLLEQAFHSGIAKIKDFRLEETKTTSKPMVSIVKSLWTQIDVADFIQKGYSKLECVSSVVISKSLRDQNEIIKLIKGEATVLLPSDLKLENWPTGYAIAVGFSNSQNKGHIVSLFPFKNGWCLFNSKEKKGVASRAYLRVLKDKNNVDELSNFVRNIFEKDGQGAIRITFYIVKKSEKSSSQGTGEKMP